MSENPKRAIRAQVPMPIPDEDEGEEVPIRPATGAGAYVMAALGALFLILPLMGWQVRAKPEVATSLNVDGTSTPSTSDAPQKEGAAFLPIDTEALVEQGRHADFLAEQRRLIAEKFRKEDQDKVLALVKIAQFSPFLGAVGEPEAEVKEFTVARLLGERILEEHAEQTGSPHEFGMPWRKKIR